MNQFLDPAFIASLRRKDAEAWEELYLFVALKLKGFILRELHPLQNRIDTVVTADDIVGSTFERAMKSIDTFNPGQSNIRTWIYNIARRLVMDLKRESFREEELFQRMHANGPPPSDGDPAKLVVEGNSHSTDSVDDLVDRLGIDSSKLTEKDRQYLECMYIRDWDDQLIAEVMGVSSSAVRVGRKRLLEKLRRLIDY